MLWDFLKMLGRFAKTSGAPKFFSRMFIIQTHDRAQKQLQQQKKKHKLFVNQNWATSLIVQHLLNNNSKGFRQLRSEDKYDSSDNAHHAIHIQRQDNAFDIQTVVSEYDIKQQQIQFQFLSTSHTSEL